MAKSSLQRSKHLLADPKKQLQVLSSGLFSSGALPTFSERLKGLDAELKTGRLEILQVNLGYMCNQTCVHCHVDAGPDRKEIMSSDTIDQVIDAIKRFRPNTLDLTGGAPEMNPEFQRLVRAAVSLSVKDIIVRSNLTILESNNHYRSYPQFFKENGVHVVSSLPHYSMRTTDRQRGEGVFSKSIAALNRLNELGYGRDKHLKLDLVYNPSGAFLPGSEKELEADFKRKLKADFDIDFNQLFCITNLPISRFLEYLLASENYEDYMETLVEAFNPSTLSGLMCRNTLSVGYDGSLYDCDFNQMLQIPISGNKRYLADFDTNEYSGRKISVHQHCYGCAAGSGSSCQGSIS
jgi:radical SAM/Cys-rich protein